MTLWFRYASFDIFLNCCLVVTTEVDIPVEARIFVLWGVSGIFLKLDIVLFSQVRIAILQYLQGLIARMDSADFVNSAGILLYIFPFNLYLFKGGGAWLSGRIKESYWCMLLQKISEFMKYHFLHSNIKFVH